MHLREKIKTKGLYEKRHLIAVKKYWYLEDFRKDATADSKVSV